MKQFESEIYNILFESYHLKFEDAVFASGLIPEKILLDRTRNIHSYFIVCKNEKKRLFSNYWNSTNFSENLRQILALQYSDLDRPLFFVYCQNQNLMIIEGNKIREAILEDPGINEYDYITNNSDEFKDVVIKIYKEL